MLFLAVETFCFGERMREHPAEQAALTNQIWPSMPTCWAYISSETCKGAPLPPDRQAPLYLQHLLHMPSQGINMGSHFLNLQCLGHGHCCFSTVVMSFGFSIHLLGQIPSWKLLAHPRTFFSSVAKSPHPGRSMYVSFFVAAVLFF
jgi:hypothetical protein